MIGGKIQKKKEIKIALYPAPTVVCLFIIERVILIVYLFCRLDRRE